MNIPAGRPFGRHRLAGDEVWVQMGIHKPTDTTDRTISFDLPANVAVYGRFAGT